MSKIINLQEPQRSHNAAANFANLIMTSTVSLTQICEFPSWKSSLSKNGFAGMTLGASRRIHSGINGLTLYANKVLLKDASCVYFVFCRRALPHFWPGLLESHIQKTPS